MTDKEIKEMILRSNGFFVTPKRICRKFSRIRPDGITVQEQMRSLQEMDIGKLVKVEKQCSSTRLSQLHWKWRNLLCSGLALINTGRHSNSSMPA